MSKTFFQFAKEIREPKERWQDAIQRASAIVNNSKKTDNPMKFKRPEPKSGKREKRTFKGKTRSVCYGLDKNYCVDPCTWREASKPDKNGRVQGAHCRMKKQGAKTAASISEALDRTFPEPFGNWSYEY